MTVNHVFVDPSVKAELVSCLIKHFDHFLSYQTEEPSYYARIINDRHFDRLKNCLGQTAGHVVYGGHCDARTRYFSPTIVDGVLTSDALMSQELFGPILPILEATLDEAISYTAENEHPLALYGFTTSQAEKDRILGRTNSGGVTFNDCILHMAVKEAPFGGVGASGSGAYHGSYGFNEFTHLRTVVNVPIWLERMLQFRYPPYSDKKAAQMISFMGAETKVTFDRQGNDTGGLIRWLLTGWLR